MIVFIDLDGTIVDSKARFERAGKEPAHRGRHYSQWLRKVQNERLLSQDRPVMGMWNIAQALASSGWTTMAYLTGRSDIYRKVTIEWLMKYGFPNAPLIMRPKYNRQRNGKLKEKLIKAYLNKTMAKLFNMVVVIDDDYVGDIEEVCHKNGWTFLKAKSGS